jgi:uncharacterized integral membrane protein
MGKQVTPKRGITPPKGRPTRARGEVESRQRVFGATSQWIALTVFIILIFVVLFILTDGGSFDYFNGGHTGSVLASAVTGWALT